MNIILPLIWALLFFIKSNCQSQSPGTRTNCNLYTAIHLKNSIDTFSTKVVLLEIGITSDDAILKKLEKKHHLIAHDFGYAVAFRLPGCKNVYYLSSRELNKKITSEIFKPENIGKTLLISCIAFRDYYVDGHPFTIIDKIKIE